MILAEVHFIAEANRTIHETSTPVRKVSLEGDLLIIPHLVPRRRKKQQCVGGKTTLGHTKHMQRNRDTNPFLYLHRAFENNVLAFVDKQSPIKLTFPSQTLRNHTSTAMHSKEPHC